MKLSRFILIITLLLLGVAAVFAINRPQNTSTNTTQIPNQAQKPVIVTTLFPFYDITKILIGDKANISLLLPPGIEPHSFEPTPQDIIKIQEADIFIYTGEYMEPWVKDIISNLPQSVTVIDASKNIPLIESSENHSHDHGHDNHHDEEHNDNKDGKSAIDPHFWLDFNNTIIATKTISDTVSSKNIIDNSLLSQNTEKLIQNLTQLDTDYTNTLSTCTNKTIIQAGHRTFEYLARKYNLEYITTEELSPNSDTSAKDIAMLIDEVKEEKSKAVFSEELIEPRIAKTISDETGVPILLLNGAHNITSDQFKSGISFIDIMRENLENLRAGLDCK
jgi:zinc transport system substrate-binding protein